MGSAGDRHVSNYLNVGLGIAVISGGLDKLTDIWGVSPDVQLDCEPWGDMNHDDGHCSCRSFDRTVAYVHELALMPRELMMPPSDGGGGGG